MKLRCPYCRRAFQWDAALPWPDNCPFRECDAEIGIPDRGEVIQMPSLRSARMAANDKVYRDIEKGSETRAQIAAETVGMPVADMAALKITDLKDNQRAGDVAAVESEAAMNRLKAMSPNTPVGFAANGAELGAGIAQGAINVNGQVITGIEPNAGARTIQRMQKKMAGL